MFENEKKFFLAELKKFVQSLSDKIAKDDEWTIKGFIDVFQNVYNISDDTKVISRACSHKKSVKNHSQHDDREKN